MTSFGGGLDLPDDPAVRSRAVRELSKEDRLAAAAKAEQHDAPAREAACGAFADDVELRDLVISAGELPRPQPRAGRIWVRHRVHIYQMLQESTYETRHIQTRLE